MIGIAILIGIGSIFFKKAKAHELNRILWSIIGVGSYFVSQLIAGVIIGLFSPELLDNRLELSLISILVGLVGTAIAWFILQSVIKNKKAIETNNELIDDNSTFHFKKDSDF